MKWFRDHKFEVHLIAFLLMSLPCIGLYFSASGQLQTTNGLLLTLIILGNGLVLFT
jgi:uncharacterized membrane protein YhhN